MEPALVSPGATPARRPRVDSTISPSLASPATVPAAPRPGPATSVLVAGSRADMLAATLARRASFRISVAPRGASLSEQIAASTPDVLVFDAGPGRAAGILRRLGRDVRLPPTVVLSDDPTAVLRPEAANAGIRAILPRQATLEVMAAAIEAVAAGLAVAHVSALPSARRGASRPAPDRRAAEPLTPREMDVLGMMAEGFGNRSIALRLRISTHTVKFHVGAILDKLDASSRTEAVAIGVRRGLIMI